MKIVINKCYGGFGLSHEGVRRYAKEANIDIKYRDVTGLPIEERLEDEIVKVLPLKVMDETPTNPGDLFGVSYYSNGDYWHELNIPRNDPALVRVVEDDSKLVSSRYGELKVVEIPDGVEWEIEEYDGSEWVSEVHQTWS